jgi:hypothetical protein
MHLVKWIRKNNRKIMVFVVVFIMLAFVVGQFGIKMLVSLMGGGNQLIATYDDGKKIKSQTFLQAQSELAILRMLMADRLLLAQSGSGFSAPLLLHLLMPESQFGSEIASQMKQAVQQGQLQVSMEELEDYFSQRSERPEILWILLKNEAYRAGHILPNESAAETLRFAIPQLTGNQMDAATLVNQIISNNNISEQQILRILADLMGVLAYTNSVLDNQPVTINQVKASLGRSKERLDAQFVKIPAEWFVDEEADVSEAELQEQFNAYRTTVAGSPAPENPFGFGYQLPKRVQLEYMVMLMDDVEAQIEKPTADDLENYYSNNIERFKKQEPIDPNNPESETIPVTQSFAEVQNQVRRAIEDEKTAALANIIFNEIKDKTESGFETLNFDEAPVTELQQAAGDYAVVGAELSQKYNVPVWTGKTGWLSPTVFGQDKILSGLSIRRGQNFLRLTDLAFAAEEEKPQRQRIGVPAVRVWENIGPLSGGYYSQEESKYFRLMALVRVVGIQQASAPESIDTVFETKGVVLEQDAVEEADAKTFSLTDQVKDDVLLLKAMDTAKDRAEELVQLIEDKGWDEAIEAYNNTYAKADLDAYQAEQQTIELSEVKQQLRISLLEMEMIKRLMQQNPASAGYMQDRLISNMLTNRLYGLLDEDAESTGTIQASFEFGPQASWYVVQEVQRQPATLKDYLDNKTQTALQLSVADSGELSLIHLSPENILKRMDFHYKLQDEPADDSLEDSADNEGN